MSGPESVVVGDFEELLLPVDENLSAFDHPRDNVFFRKCGVSTALVGLKYPGALYFQGIFDVNVICGKLLIDGYCSYVGDARLPLRLFSVLEGSASCLSTTPDSQVSSVDLSKFHKEFVSLVNELRRCIGAVGCVICLSSRSKLYTDWKICLDRHQLGLFPNINRAPGIPLFAEGEKFLGSIFDVKDGLRISKKVAISEDMENVAETLVASLLNNPGQRFRAMVCGGKGVGKSFSLKYFMNTFLVHESSVLYIDLDIGQPEFTLSGCVSAIIVDKPVIGPNYTHLKKPLRSFYVGDVNPVQCLNSYVQALSALAEFCHSDEECKRLPWFINTMGMNKGLGVDFIAATVSNFQPSQVVQIYSDNKKDNFAVELTSSYFRESSSFSFSQSMDQVVYDFHRMRSITATLPRSSVVLSSAKLREALVVVYLSSILAHQNLNQWSQKLSEELTSSASEEGLILGDVVALCQKMDKVYLCHDYGIVHDIKDSQVVGIASPLEDFGNINCCVKVPVNFKASVILEHFKMKAGPIPNICSFNLSVLKTDKKDLLKALFALE